MRKLLFWLGVVLGWNACANPALQLESPHLQIKPLGPHTYQHTSFLNSSSYGKVPCNGLIVAKSGEAVVMDTPLNDSLSNVLIDWIDENLEAKVVAVVPTHFHIDCTAGIAAFHQRSIPSYSNALTCALMLENDSNAACAQQLFQDSIRIKVGSTEVLLWFPGAGHTSDNVVGWVADDQVLFGGCLVKAIGAGKGNLNDARVSEWSASILRVKNRFPKAKVVLPGHGKSGDQELLDYTYRLFMHE